jgi:hypothetical protein
MPRRRMGSGGIVPPFLISALNGSGQLRTSAALPPEKQSPIPIAQEAGELVWTLWRREKSLVLTRN